MIEFDKAQGFARAFYFARAKVGFFKNPGEMPILWLGGWGGPIFILEKNLACQIKIEHHTK